MNIKCTAQVVTWEVYEINLKCATQVVTWGVYEINLKCEVDLHTQPPRSVLRVKQPGLGSIQESQDPESVNAQVYVLVVEQ